MTKDEHPLAGVKVLDLSSLIMGPLAAQVLAEYGADVIKVEPPDGDVMRHAGAMRNPGMGAMFLHANRGKKSVAVDLKSDVGREVLYALLNWADVLVHNVRPAAMKRLGLDYEALSARKPDIIYLSLVGYGQNGPYAAFGTVDDIIQGASGVAALLARDGRSPTYIPLAIVDRICGISAATAATAALYHRARHGKGAYIELPMFETMARLVLGDHMGGETFIPPLGPMGYQRLLARDRRPYRTRDGYIACVLYTDKHWSMFFTRVGRPEVLSDNPQFADKRTRPLNYDALYAIVADLLQSRTTAEWMDLLREIDVPCMPVHDLKSLMQDEHLRSISFFREELHPTEGRIRTMGTAMRWNGQELADPTHAPSLGENAVEVLRSAGVPEPLIARACTSSQRPQRGS